MMGDTSADNSPMRSTTLIVVCCHAIYTGTSPHGEKAGEDESQDWLIAPFQKGETPTFIEHARAGILTLQKCLANGEDAILVFSGGATKLRQGCTLTEGQSYLVSLWSSGCLSEYTLMWQNLCIARGFFGQDTVSTALRSRTFAEEYATDSYQNVLLSLIQWPTFRRSVSTNDGSSEVPISSSGRWPQKLVIISHEFKRSRFMDLHLPAIDPPLQAVEFIGINPPFNDEQLAEVVEGDKLRGYGAWQTDSKGTGSLLRQKRLDRSWSEDEFIRICITNDDTFSPAAKNDLIALVKGHAGGKWPPE